jgi:hypothetical protein
MCLILVVIKFYDKKVNQRSLKLQIYFFKLIPILRIIYKLMKTIKQSIFDIIFILQQLKK